MRGRRRARILIRGLMCGFALVTLANCGSPAKGLVDSYKVADAVRQDFTVCHGYGCAKKERTSISDEEWALITREFLPAPRTAEEERKRISRAIARFEQIVGPKTGTAMDGGGAAIFGRSGSLDCIDESVNTTTYLTFLQRDGFLQYHDIGSPVVRGNIVLNDWPSNTAIIVEKGTGHEYTVDSYWHDNGKEPEIMPLYLWTSLCWLDAPQCRRAVPDEVEACCAQNS